MKRPTVSLFVSCMALLTLSAAGQGRYHFSIDLAGITNDVVQVTLKTPPVNQKTAVFAFPKIIPGTYAIADYGKFISNIKAFDKNGKPLSVSRLNDNQWKISGADKLDAITYSVEDVFDTKQSHHIYPMAATNFEVGKNFVLNLPGIFGYIDGVRNIPFEFSIEKPAGLYGATSLQPLSSTATKDVFRAPNLDVLYDSPIMYTVPDTASVIVGNCKVLVSVYSPNQLVHAKQVAGWMSQLLDAARRYLGGRLPADNYAFLYYFKDPKNPQSFPRGLGGALEHPTSSFYYLPEMPAERMKDNLVDVSSHEFFHIITPLTIASREVKEFNFNEAVMSKHLWLYEGVTEYTAHHVQVKYGLNTPQQFLDKLSEKITNSRTRYIDTLAFTELSKESVGKWAEQYANVYEKGALIAACLDLYLLHLSNGAYGLRNLTYDLGVRYGKYRYFNDEELFDAIAELTYPQVKEFLQTYVGGSKPIPYEYYFGLAGLKFAPRTERSTFTFGSISFGANERGVIIIQAPFNPNEFGKKMGYKLGDEIYSIQGVAVHAQNLYEVINSVLQNMKEGEPFVVKTGRKNNTGGMDTLILQAPAEKITVADMNKLTFIPDATAQQLLVRKAWLTPANNSDAVERPAANPADVNAVDALVKATYEVISGPAGPRNWDRFFSLFLPGAQMGAVVQPASGQPVFRSITPESYRRGNAPHFDKNGFYEEELNRKVMQFGNIATVQSAYQFRFTPGGKIEQRGVNYFTLVKNNGRWWISNLVWQDEGKDLPLPAELLKK